MDALELSYSVYSNVKESEKTNSSIEEALCEPDTRISRFGSRNW